jgi:hypothetical protein
MGFLRQHRPSLLIAVAPKIIGELDQIDIEQYEVDLKLGRVVAWVAVQVYSKIEYGYSVFPRPWRI